MAYRYLFNRWVDPVVGVAVGVAAYFVQEQKLRREPGHSLTELMRLRGRS